MKFDMETQLLSPSCSKDWRKHTVIIAFTAIFVCTLIVILYVRLETTGTTEESRTSYESGFVGPVGSTGLPRTPKPAGSPGMGTLPEESQNLTTSQGTVEGIIVGTDDGVVIIPLDSLKQRTIGSPITCGVAFNWESRKVYWIEYGVGIKTADLDGTSVELVIGDTSFLWGLAVDQVTGNFYYGVTWPNLRIQVCDSMGKKCATVVSGANIVGSDIFDITLFPSKGLMFWSSLSDKKSVSRANMDGRDSTIIILENIYGIFLHEFEEKLYWANYYAKSIGHSDLYGHSRNVLLNTTTMYPFDIAVNGDTLYFGGYNPNGVYSVTSNRKVSTIANVTKGFYHIALYGRNKVSSRQNPCKNSPCENLCVLNRLSYSCL